MIKKKRVLDRFLNYIQIDSPSRQEKDFAEHIKTEMEEMGFEVELDDVGEKVGCNVGNLIGRLKGNTEGKPFMFSAHLDTVSPGSGIKPQIKDGIIYSDGTTVLGSDDKAGIAAILEAIETAIEKDIARGDIEVLFTIHEEGGLYGSKNLDYSKIESTVAYVFDSDGAPGQIINQGPAQDKIEVKFIGKEAHAGVAPEEGISAIEIAAQAISNMKLLRIDEETTANIGVIEGGEVTNIVTSQVRIIGEVRSLNNNKLKEQVEHMIKCCEDAARKFDGEVEVNVYNAYSAFHIGKDEDIVKGVAEICEDLGLESRIVSSGGGSDTNILNRNGIKAINLGVGMKKPHTVDEHISIKDLENSARLALGIIEKYSK